MGRITAATIVVALSGVAPVAASASPRTWGAPTPIVSTSSAAVNGVSCSSRTLCVAVDSTGDAVVSENPAARSPVWTSTAIDPGRAMDAISCPSSSLCVAVDNHGDAVITTDPAASSPTWAVSTIDGTNQLSAVTCRSSTLCVAIDVDGNALVSQNPAAASPTWTSQRIAAGSDTKALSQVACVSTTLCVVIDGAGNTIISQDPTAAVPTWTTRPIDKTAGVGGLSCPSGALCVSVDDYGGSYVTTDPTAATPTWKYRTIDPETGSGVPGTTGVSCPSISLCVAVDTNGFALTSTDPAAKRSRWTRTLVRPDFSALGGVTCQSRTLCVAFGGRMVSVSTDPAAATHRGYRPGTYRGVIQGGGHITIKIARSSVTAINVSARWSCQNGITPISYTYSLRSRPGSPAPIRASGTFKGNHLKFASPDLYNNMGKYWGSGSVSGTVTGTTITGNVDVGGGTPDSVCGGGGLYFATLNG